MTKSILRYFIIVLIVSLLSSCLLSATLISNHLLETTEHDMLYSLKLIDYALDYNQPLEEQIQDLNPLAYSDNTRLTIIADDGTVLADTALEHISEKHLEREEVKEALATHEGYARRKSETTNENMLYVAYYNPDHILR